MKLLLLFASLLLFAPASDAWEYQPKYDAITKALNEGDIKQAENLVDAWREEQPYLPWMWVARGLVAARAGHQPATLQALERAARYGLTDSSLVEKNAVFDFIRETDGYEAFLKKVQENAAGGLPFNAIEGEITVRALENGEYTEVTTPYILCMPPGYKEAKFSVPVCVILHGYGANERDLLDNVANFGRKGVAYLLLRGPYPLEQGGFSWFPTGEFSMSDTEAINLQAVAMIRDAMKDARSKDLKLAEGHVGALGFSLGAQVANALALYEPRYVRTVFSVGCRNLNWRVLQPDLIARAGKLGITFHLYHGKRDTVVPVASAKELSNALKKVGVDVDLTLYDGGHEFTPEVNAAIRQWVAAEIRRTAQ